MDVLKGKVARELVALDERMEREFERVLHSGMRLPRGPASFRPDIDVYETDQATIVRADLAGVSSDDIQLIVDGEYLQISGNREALCADTPARHLLMEIPQGRFERVLRLPSPYDASRVVAKFEAGLLVVELPRVESSARKIPVRSGS